MINQHLYPSNQKQNSVLRVLKNFSLVEMLILIAVWAVLISVLSPSLKNALDSSYTGKCLSKFGKNSRSWMMYLDDNGGMFWNCYSGKEPPWPSHITESLQEK
jgi:hypothetical protein